MEPISAALTGLALVQKSVEFVKGNIQTAQDIHSIFGMVDSALNGQSQINQQRWGQKSIIGQHKSAAHAVIDAKLAQEAIDEMKDLIDYRFGFGTWQEILKLRNDRIREEREEERRIRIQKRRQRKEILQVLSITGITVGTVLACSLITFFIIKVF